MKSRHYPSNEKSGHGKAGFTLIEVMFVVGIIGILLVIAVPGWIRQRTISQARACQQNLRTIDQGKEMYCYSAGLSTGMTVTWDDLLRPGEREKAFIRSSPICPAGGTYSLNLIGYFPECSLGAVTLLDGSEAAQHKITGISGGSGS